MAQFQTYCRNLHDDTIDVQVAHATAKQTNLLRTLMTQGRKLDTQTPRTSVLGSDFPRLGFSLLDGVRAHGAPGTAGTLRLLDVLVDFRNAIVHGNETQIRAIIASGDVKATIGS